MRVLLADREGPARRAVAALLRELASVELVGEVGRRDDVARALRHARPDVLLIDDRLLLAGDHVLAGLGPLPGAVRVIVTGVDDDPAFAERARRLGADAWLSKDTADAALPVLLAAT